MVALGRLQIDVRKMRASIKSLTTFLFLLLSFCPGRNAQEWALQSSIDLGETWQRHEKPRTWAPPTGLVRLLDTSMPMILVPACALIASLEVTVWHPQADQTPFALSWESPSCDSPPRNDTTITVSTRLRRARSYETQWVRYVHERPSPGSEEGSTVDGKKQGFFSKYGLYIMGFVGFALAHGIRKGFAELQEESEREDAAAAAAAARERRQPDHPVVVIPRNRKAARSRKKSSAK